MITLWIAALLSIATADEGFSIHPPTTPGLLRAWNSTYMLFFGGEGDTQVTSAFVVGKTGSSVDLLTVDHALPRYCDQVRCRKVRVYKTESFKWRSTRPRPKPLTTDVEVIARDSSADLALVRVRIDHPGEPLKLAAECTKTYVGAYAFGYPLTELRLSPSGIERADQIRMRWSSGRVLRRGVVGAGQRISYGPSAVGQPVIVTSADTLPGGSGGPLTNEGGDVLGMVVRSGTSERDGFVYRGRGEAERFQVNAIAASCESIRAFLN